MILTDSTRVPGSAAGVPAPDDVDVTRDAVNGALVECQPARAYAASTRRPTPTRLPVREEPRRAGDPRLVNGYRDTPGHAEVRRARRRRRRHPVLPLRRRCRASARSPTTSRRSATTRASEASLRRTRCSGQDAYGADDDRHRRRAPRCRCPTSPSAAWSRRRTRSRRRSTTSSGSPTARCPTPTSSLVTGYDFLTDAADARADATSRAGLGAGAHRHPDHRPGRADDRRHGGRQPSRTHSGPPTDLGPTPARGRTTTWCSWPGTSAPTTPWPPTTTRRSTPRARAGGPGPVHATRSSSAPAATPATTSSTPTAIAGLTDPLDWTQAMAAAGRDADRRHRATSTATPTSWSTASGSTSTSRAQLRDRHRRRRRSARRWCRPSRTTSPAAGAERDRREGDAGGDALRPADAEGQPPGQPAGRR